MQNDQTDMKNTGHTENSLDNQTERLDNREEHVNREAEEKLAEGVQRTYQKRDGVVPHHIIQFLGLMIGTFLPRPPGNVDLTKNPEKHLDVRNLKQHYPGLSITSRVRVAWLLWRARNVMYWLTRDGKGPTWAACLDAAVLGDESALHQLAFDRRSAHYAAQAAVAEDFATCAPATLAKAEEAADARKQRIEAEKAEASSAQANPPETAVAKENTAEAPIASAKSGFFKRSKS